MKNLATNIGKIKLKNPVMSASGTFGYAKEFEDLVDLTKLGAIVTKTITLEPRLGNPMPRICETASGMLNAIGLQNEGIDNFIKEKLPYLADIGVPVIVSISGNNSEEFCILAKRLDKLKSINGIELNISCPNIHHPSSSIHHPSSSIKHQASSIKHPSSIIKHQVSSIHHLRLIAQDKAVTYELVKAVRKITKKTLITKLSPNVTDITEIAKASEDAGTDAVSLVNTFLGMAIDIKTRKPILGNVTGGLSGPCIKPIALRMVWEVSRAIDIPIIGIGGIMNANDAIEFMIAGASAVQVGTANFIEPNACENIIKGIEEYYSV
jgi:dihydroorotate dehydrogenase (NAD+) catalytic subunit